ncbi:MAG: hypothetical protein EAX89_10780 [Candidatus Lokiarchaeota archaeon]|nr:hypothetical protein [Candidatus Lokiarchaeota archaeon]
MSKIPRDLKYFSTGTFYLMLSSVLGFSLRLISRIVIARYSSVEVYGMFSIIWSEANFISILALFGLGQQLTIVLPRKLKNDQSKMIISSGFYVIVIGLFFYFFSLILNSFEDVFTLKYSTLISSFFILFLLFQFIYVGLKDFLGYFLLNMTQNLFFFIFVVFYRTSLSPNNLVSLLIISIIVSTCTGIIYLIKTHKINSSLQDIYSFSFIRIDRNRFYLFSADIVNNSILYLVLKIPEIVFNDLSIPAYISVAFSILAILILPSQMISTVMAPLISEQVTKRKKEELTSTFGFTLTFIFVLQGLTIIGSFCFGDMIISIYGSGYLLNSFMLFQILLFATTIDSLNYAYKFLVRNTNHENLFAAGKWLSLIIYLILQLVFSFILDKKGFSVVFAYTGYIIAQFLFYFLVIYKLNILSSNYNSMRISMWLIFLFFSSLLVFNISINTFTIIERFLVFFLNSCLFIVYLQIFRVINLKSIMIRYRFFF